MVIKQLSLNIILSLCVVFEKTQSFDVLKPLFALFINYVLFFGLVSALGSCQLKEFYFYLKHKDKNIFYLLVPFPFPVVLNCLRNLSSCTLLSPVWILSFFFKSTVFSPVWILSCFFKDTVFFVVLSPMWVLSCSFKYTLW